MQAKRPLRFGEAYGLLGRGKKAQGAYPYTEYVNRPLGRVAAALALRLSVSANTLSVLSMIVTVIGVVLAASTGPSEYVRAIPAYLLLAIAYVLDSADGPVARVAGTAGPAGEWLDHTFDSIKIVLLNGAFVYVVAFTSPGLAGAVPELAFISGVLLCAAQNSLFFGGTLFVKMRQASGDFARPTYVGRILFWPLDWGVFVMLTLLLPTRSLFAAGYSLYSGLLVIAAAARLSRYFRRLASSGP